MGEFFGSLYCVFEDLFGLELADYLWGHSSPLATTNAFISIGLWMFGISLAVCLLYYYAIDHPRWSNCLGWGVFLLINAVINFLVGWQWVLDDYYADKMVRRNPVTDLLEPLNIGTSDFLCFGVSNMLLSILAFIIFSLIVKWKSTNSSHSPF